MQRQLTGEELNDLDALQPSYLRALFAKDFNYQAFVIGSGYVGVAVGAYLNYDSYLSTYLGALGSQIAGHVVSSAVVGYVIDGVEGAKTGVCAYANLLNVSPQIKLAIKMGFTLVDKSLEISSAGIVTSRFGTLIKETPMELMEVYCNGAKRSLTVFSQANRDYKRKLEIERIEKQEELSQSNNRNGK
jgi:hypothetical protein